jgi:hypothetical protein
VDQAAAKDGKRDAEAKKLLVQSMLDALDQEDTDHAATLDELLKDSEGNSNFILED